MTPTVNAVFGSATPSSDRFGDTKWAELNAQVVQLVPHTGEPAFEDAIADSSLASPAGYARLSAPWYFVGEEESVGVEVDGPCPIRYRVRNRLGPLTGGERTGLDLEDANDGVVIALPYLSGRSSALEVRVYQRIDRWQRAADRAGDPLFGDPAGRDVLPVDDACDPVYNLEPRWRLIPEGALDTGTGARFSLDDSGRRLLVVTDSLGVFQAFTR
ncbi:MAG: hypothetical protein AAF658_07200 [Myxococcota bacterium]